MTLKISKSQLDQIHAHGEASYPEEGAGVLIGEDGRVERVLPLPNAREDGSRHNRYSFAPRDYLDAEDLADSLGLSLIGAFHSHPDHPNRPSAFDLEWAQPFLIYVITNVQNGKAVESRAWKLAEDRSQFFEEKIQIIIGRE